MLASALLFAELARERRSSSRLFLSGIAAQGAQKLSCSPLVVWRELLGFVVEQLAVKYLDNTIVVDRWQQVATLEREKTKQCRGNVERLNMAFSVRRLLV